MKWTLCVAAAMAAMVLAGCGGQGGPIGADSSQAKQAGSAELSESQDKDIGKEFFESGQKRYASESTESKLTSGPENSSRLVVDQPLRSVVRSASLKVRVQDVETSQKQIGTMVIGWGGFVESSQQNLNEGPSGSDMTLRVPSEHFNEALEQIAGMGLRISQSVSTDDITGSIVDMQARLATMKAQEEAYRNLLRQRHSRSEIEEYVQRLSALRSQIEQVAGNLKTNQIKAALPVIHLSLEQSSSLTAASTGDAGWLNESWGAAYSAMGVVYRGVASLAIWALLAAPLWVPIAILLRRLWKTPKPA